MTSRSDTKGWEVGLVSVSVESRLVAPPVTWRPTRGMFSAGSPTLDPRVFESSEHMRPDVRARLLGTLSAFWTPRYPNWASWSKVYLAGSAASHWWDSDADLDVLIGIDVEALRRDRPQNVGVSEADIVAHLNYELRTELEPLTTNLGGFVTTYRVNPGSYDIRAIRPYAAYSITDDQWVVRPPSLPEDWGPKSFPDHWWRQARQIAYEAEVVLAMDEPARTAAVTTLFDWLKRGRQVAYGPHGRGWMDWGNFIWQYLSQTPDRLLARLYEVKHPELAKVARQYGPGLVGRGLVLSDYDWSFAKKVIDGTVTAADFVRVLSPLGYWWFVMGDHADLEDVEDYAYASPDVTLRTMVEDDDERRVGPDFIGGEIAVILLAKRPTVDGEPWNPEVHNPDNGLMGNSYLVPGQQLEMVEVRYDAGWGWKSLPAQGLRANAVRSDAPVAFFPQMGGGKYHACHTGVGETALCRSTILVDKRESPIHVEPGQERVHPIVCRRCLTKVMGRTAKVGRIDLPPHLAGPGSSRIPQRLRSLVEPVGRMLRQPRPVVLDEPAQDDLEDAPPDVRAKAAQALQQLRNGRAEIEAKARELAGAFTLRLTNSWRMGIYLGAEMAWHVFWIGNHNYDEAERRLAARRQASAVHHQRGTPLNYRGRFPGTPHRLYITDSSAPPWGRSRGNFEGSPDDLVAFLDVFEYEDAIYVAFITTRDGYEGSGFAQRLLDAVYERWPDKTVVWGELMTDSMDHLHEKYRQRHPSRTAGTAWQPWEPPSGSNVVVSTGGDAVPGGYNGYIAFFDKTTGEKIGYIDYQSGGGEVQIAMVEVEPKYRRQGYATLLLKALKNDFPNVRIDSGMLTDDGARWWPAVRHLASADGWRRSQRHVDTVTTAKGVELRRRSDSPTRS